MTAQIIDLSNTTNVLVGSDRVTTWTDLNPIPLPAIAHRDPIYLSELLSYFTSLKQKRLEHEN